MGDYNTVLQQDDNKKKKPKQHIIAANKQQQQQQQQSNYNTRRIITPAAPVLGLFTNKTKQYNTTAKSPPPLSAVVAAKNLHQIISSGRILDRDTLRKSQIKQNKDHQQANRLRPWNNAKRFLPTS